LGPKKKMKARVEMQEPLLLPWQHSFGKQVLSDALLAGDERRGVLLRYAILLEHTDADGLTRHSLGIRVEGLGGTPEHRLSLEERMAKAMEENTPPGTGYSVEGFNVGPSDERRIELSQASPEAQEAMRRVMAQGVPGAPVIKVHIDGEETAVLRRGQSGDGVWAVTELLALLPEDHGEVWLEVRYGEWHEVTLLELP
jgi:hypothetical protein